MPDTLVDLNEQPTWRTVSPYEDDTIDLARTAAYFQPKAGRCAGQRVIFQGFPCPHCDSPNPLSRCKAPKNV